MRLDSRWISDTYLISLFLMGRATMTASAQDSSAAPVGHTGAAIQIEERPALTVSGWLVLAVLLAGFVIAGITQLPALGLVMLVLAGISLTSFVVLQPGQTRVVQFFGQYIGTVRRTGLTCVVPLTV